jgi:hypothetical protein
MNTRLIDIVTEDVQKLFGFSETDLFNLKVDVGLQYLEQRFEHDPNIGKLLSTHPAFWLWWRERWAERDREIIRKVSGKPVPRANSFLWNWYARHHSAENISFYPNYVLINQCLGEREALKNL